MMKNKKEQIHLVPSLSCFDGLPNIFHLRSVEKSRAIQCFFLSALKRRKQSFVKFRRIFDGAWPLNTEIKQKKTSTNSSWSYDIREL